MGPWIDVIIKENLVIIYRKKKIKTHLYPAVIFLAIFLSNVIHTKHENMYTRLFIVALFDKSHKILWKL